jgi:hypothetical protein
MLFKATYNNNLVISWRSVLLVEETGVSRENHWPVASHWQTLSHNFVSSTPRLSGVRTHNVSGEINIINDICRAMHDVNDWNIFLGKDMTNVLKPIYMCDQNFAQILFSIYTRILQVMYQIQKYELMTRL